MLLRIFDAPTETLGLKYDANGFWRYMRLLNTYKNSDPVFGHILCSSLNCVAASEESCLRNEGLGALRPQTLHEIGASWQALVVQAPRYTGWTWSRRVNPVKSLVPKEPFSWDSVSCASLKQMRLENSVKRMRVSSFLHFYTYLGLWHCE